MDYDAEDCEEPHKLREDDLVIAIMGPTGTGKSNIIDTLTGQLGKRASRSMKSCTTVVGAVRIKNHCKYGDRIVLVDTPGFDDTEKSDLEILRIISDWLIYLCQTSVFLCGIVYLHRITDTRMSGSHQRNLSMLGELCGTCAAKKVTLVTTMWDGVESNDLGVCEKSEEELKSIYWKSLLDHGASTARFQNTQKSAWVIIDNILAKPVENITLRLQQEIVSLGRPLEETEAAKKLAGAAAFPPTPTKVMPQNRAGAATFPPTSKKIMPQSQAHIMKDSGIVILLLGQTGSGKSTFINAAAGRDVAKVNHSLISSNLMVQDFIVQHPQTTRSLVFVETPGFDHYSASDWEVLKEIVEWLKRSCHSDVSFGGIVYLHDITVSRIQKQVDNAASALRNLGRTEIARHLLMTTVKWERTQLDSHAMHREQVLKTNLWKEILENGGQSCRFANTKDSVWEIIDTLLQEEPLELAVLQRELDKIHRLIPSRVSRQDQVKKGFFTQLLSLLFQYTHDAVY